MARSRRAYPGLSEAPDLLVLIERARASAALPGSAQVAPAPFAAAPLDRAAADPAAGDPASSGPTLPGVARSGRASPGPAPPDAALSGTDGHRSRMRTRLLTAGPQSLADHEMLEMVLFLALPRRDTKPLARALLARFGSFAGTIAAPASEIVSVDGLGEAGVAALKLVQAAALRLARAEVSTARCWRTGTG